MTMIVTMIIYAYTHVFNNMCADEHFLRAAAQSHDDDELMLEPSSTRSVGSTQNVADDAPVRSPAQEDETFNEKATGRRGT